MQWRMWLILSVICLLVPSYGRAEELVWATGRVYTADGKKPLVGAMVAVYDDKNRVIDYAKTDENGDYALAVPRGALHLTQKSGGGFLNQVVGNVGSFVGGAGKIVAYPLRAGIKVAADAANATDPLTKVGVGAASSIAGSLIDTFAPGDKGKKNPTTRTAPGAIVMKVSAPGRNDAISIAKVYWMQQEVYRAGGKEQSAITAWVDPVHMTDAGNEKPSTITSEYMTFTSARLEPSIAEPGQKVTLTVAFPTPTEPRAPVILVARDSKNGASFELTNVGGNLYRGEFIVDKTFPRNDQMICVLAYAQQADRAGRSRKVEDAMNGAGMWNPSKPYIYNPLIAASRNRAEVALTVVNNSK